MMSSINRQMTTGNAWRSEEHTSELQSLRHLVCRLLLEKIERLAVKRKRVLRSSVRSSRGSKSARSATISAPIWCGVPEPTENFFFFNDPAPPKFSPLSLQAVLRY